MSIKTPQNGKIAGSGAATSQALASGRIVEQINHTTFQTKDPPSKTPYNRYWIRRNDQYRSFREEIFKVDGFPTPPELLKRFGTGEWLVTPLDPGGKEIETETRVIVVESNIGATEMAIAVKGQPTQQQQVPPIAPPPPPPPIQSDLASVLLANQLSVESEEKKRILLREEEERRRLRLEQERLDLETIALNKKIELEEQRSRSEIESRKNAELDRIRLEAERLAKEAERKAEREDREERERKEAARKAEERKERLEEEERKFKRELALKELEEKTKREEKEEKEKKERLEREERDRKDKADREEKERKEKAERELRREEIEARERKEKTEKEERDRKDKFDREERDRKDRTDREEKERKEKADREDRERKDKADREEREARDRKEKLEFENLRLEREDRARKDLAEAETRRYEREERERKERNEAEEKRIAREKEEKKERMEFIIGLATPVAGFVSSTLVPLVVDKLKDKPPLPPPPESQGSGEARYMIEKLRDIENKIETSNDDSYRSRRDRDDDYDEDENRKPDPQKAIEEKLSWMRLGMTQGGEKKEEGLLGKFDKYMPMIMGALAPKPQKKPQQQQVQQQVQQARETPPQRLEVDQEELERQIHEREQAAYEMGIKAQHEHQEAVLREHLASQRKEPDRNTEQQRDLPDQQEDLQEDPFQNVAKRNQPQELMIPASKVEEITEKTISDTFASPEAIYQVIMSDPGKYAPAIKELINTRGAELYQLSQEADSQDQTTEDEDPDIQQELDGVQAGEDLTLSNLPE